jgi:HEPN domain-containing protein
MKNYRRSHGYTERDLLHSATDHLASARRLFESGPRCFDSAGYLSHLGIELILKAFLLNRTDAFPNDHSLARLLSLLRIGRSRRSSIPRITQPSPFSISSQSFDTRIRKPPSRSVTKIGAASTC